MRKRYSLMEAIYGDYPENAVEPLMSTKSCGCAHDCDGSNCSCEEAMYCSCGHELSEAILQDGDEEILMDDKEDAELEEASAGGVPGGMAPLGYDDEEPLEE
jgi:hypothetical protein